MRFLPLGLVVLVGCTPSKPEGDLPPLHPVTGKIVKGGAPFAGGMVRLDPITASPDLIVNGLVDKDGKFTLQTTHGQSQKKATGVPAGEYRVVYFPPGGDQTQGKAAPLVQPSKKFIVGEGANELVIDLDKP